MRRPRSRAFPASQKGPTLLDTLPSFTLATRFTPVFSMESSYFAVLVSFGIAALVAGVFVGAGALIRPRRPSVVKSDAFECGNVSSGPAWGRFSVKFYLTAILFIVFDVEVVFLYPWAIMFRSLGFFGFFEMAIFVLILTLGFVYVWRKGALEWD